MAAKPNAKAPLGQGGRFAAVKAAAAKSGARNPAAVAAAAGRKKYGAKKMAAMAAAGRGKSAQAPGQLKKQAGAKSAKTFTKGYKVSQSKRKRS